MIIDFVKHWLKVGLTMAAIIGGVAGFIALIGWLVNGGHQTIAIVLCAAAVTFAFAFMTYDDF